MHSTIWMSISFYCSSWNQKINLPISGRDQSKEAEGKRDEEQIQQWNKRSWRKNNLNLTEVTRTRTARTQLEMKFYTYVRDRVSQDTVPKILNSIIHPSGLSLLFVPDLHHRFFI